MKVLILAAGDGTRLGRREPKPLVEFLGKPLIEIALTRIVRAGLKHVVVTVGFEGQKIEDWLKNNQRRIGFHFEIAVNENWADTENGYSVLVAKKLLENEERFLIVMCDHILDPIVFNKLAGDRLEGFDIGLAVDIAPGEWIDIKEASKTKLEGDYIVAHGKDLSEFDGVDMGAFVAKPSFFKYLERCAEMGDTRMDTAMHLAAQDRKAKGIRFRGIKWIDIDTPEDFQKALNIFRPDEI
ncbi:MAG: hypothetical protein DRQ10_03895 [Candidatus Hydrothermota bacterium]|nr:MAG: hypothetical protein DRQ10_03895 [Candidatus Hydrothermae bacterium]